MIRELTMMMAMFCEAGGGGISLGTWLKYVAVCTVLENRHH